MGLSRTFETAPTLDGEKTTRKIKQPVNNYKNLQESTKWTKSFANSVEKKFQQMQ